MKNLFLILTLSFLTISASQAFEIEESDVQVGQRVVFVKGSKYEGCSAIVQDIITSIGCPKARLTAIGCSIMAEEAPNSLNDNPIVCTHEVRVPGQRK